MKNATYQHNRAMLNARLARARTEQNVATFRTMTLVDQLRALDLAELQSYSDEQLLGDDDLRRWGCSLLGLAAHRRMRDLQGADLPAGLYVPGFDQREPWTAQQMPTLGLALARGQATADVVKGIYDWADRWALGRVDMMFEVVDQALSAQGHWVLLWDISSNAASVGIEGDAPRKIGQLDEVVEWVAQNVWYSVI